MAKNNNLLLHGERLKRVIIFLKKYVYYYLSVRKDYTKHFTTLKIFAVIRCTFRVPLLVAALRQRAYVYYALRMCEK